MSRLALLFALISSATASQAAPPRVVTDILPVHSLAAQVMSGVDAPSLLIPPGASPHDYAMRPSEARTLSAADVVFWVGPALTPQLDTQIAALAGDARSVVLIDLEGTTRLEMRETAGFGPEHEDHHGAEDTHSHDGVDPHAWLDPLNARRWLTAMADTLAQLDPDNAGTYRGNAAEGIARIEATEADIAPMTDRARSGSHIVYHDAFQYFERRFDLPASGSISTSDATDPSPARIAQVRALIAEQDVDCVLSEPQFNAGLIETVLEGRTSRTAVIDPIGSGLEPGAGVYPALIREIASALAACR